MELILYSVKDANNVIGKTMNEISRVNITMKKTEDIERPTIVLTDTGLTYNYAKIPFFTRYYFIDEFKRGTNGLITLDLSVDVLETYKDDILNAQVTTLNYYSSGGVTSAKKRKDIYASDVTLESAETTLMNVITGGLNND